MAEVTSTSPGRQRKSGGRQRLTAAFVTERQRARYSVTMVLLGLLAAVSTIGLLVWDNPMPLGSEGFWAIARMRAERIVVMAFVALCHAAATVAFQTVTANRIITPSIMGFEALYRVVQTSLVFVLGAAGVVLATGAVAFFGQMAAMVALAGLLYGWLLSGRLGNVHVMLLVGVVIGGGLGALATFMQRLLTPSDFDVLTARLLGNVSNAETDYLAFVVPSTLVVVTVLWRRSGRLDVLGMGREIATNVGIDHRRETRIVLLLVSLLMAMSTSMVGPMTFLGFLTATIAYQLADTHRHRLILPMAFLIGYTVLAGAYFVLHHVFYAAGAVTVVIELVGGLTFLVVILRKGRL